MSTSVLRKLRFFAASWKEDKRTDMELLAQFVQTHDERAFSTLVGRHSELVWGVCQRVLRNRADAEDAVQVTFMRLARDAGRIVNRETLSGWLFRVARCSAVDVHRSILRQKRLEAGLEGMATRVAESNLNDLRLILDDELAQLPPSARAVLILCTLEGRTYAEAARELGCSISAIHRRLSWAQLLLRRRFQKYGKEMAGALAGMVLGTTTLPSASAAPIEILAQAVESGLAVVGTGQWPAGRIGALAAASAGGSFATRLGIKIGSMSLAALVVAGALVWGLQSDPALPVAGGTSPTMPASAGPAEHRTTVTGVIRGPDGLPFSGAKVVALARRPFAPGERGLRDESIAESVSDDSGRFSLRVPDDFETWFAGRPITIHASGANFAPATIPVRLRRSPDNLELKLGSASVLRGRLLDNGGRAAMGVRVEVVRIGDAVAEPIIGEAARTSPPDWPAAAKTDADGRFEFPTLGGSSNVWIRIADERFALDVFRVDGANDVQLDAARPLVVEVRAADTGEILPGARVTVITDRVGSHPHFSAAEFAVLGPRTVPADIDAITDKSGSIRVGLAPSDHAEVLVHTPAGAGPYVGVRTHVEMATNSVEQKIVVRLPRGRWVSGVVSNGKGQPMAYAAVHWGRESATTAEWRDEFLVGRDAITRTGSDGRFKLAVLPGPTTIRVYGSTADFAPVATKLPGAPSTTLFAHSVYTVEVPQDRDVLDLNVRLQTVPPLSGTIEYPTLDSGSTFLIASGRVSPVRGYAALPIAVSEGRFTVPGCRPGFSTRVYLLDPKSRVGGMLDVVPGAPIANAKLAACGSIRFRVIDSEGKPKVGEDVGLNLLVNRDRSVDSPSDVVADPQPVEWFDAINYPNKPKTNDQGEVELRALIPGARYQVSVGSSKNKVEVGKFVIESGQLVSLPDVVVLPRPERGMR